MKHYSMIVVVFSCLLSIVLMSCGKSDDEQMAAAELSGAHQQWSNAMYSYREMLKAHPDGPRAAEAHYKMGMILYGQLKDVAGGAATFEAIAGRFPQSPEAPKSLMILGFLFSEEREMKNADSSKKYYSILIEKYPASDLVQGAKLQLEQADPMDAPQDRHMWKDSVAKSPSARALAH